TIKELGRLVPLPLIGGQPVVEVCGTYARIFWTTDKPASSLVAMAPDSTYKNNQEYTQVIGDATASVENHEVLISELKPNTEYHYQVRSKTPVSDTAKSRDFTFKTKQEQIEIITYKIENVSDSESLFSWTTNVPTDSKVSYIPYGKDGKIIIDALKSNYDKNMVVSHAVKVKDLEGGQIYQVELSGEDAGGNIVSKTLSTFSTSEIDSPPVITQVQTDAALIPGAQTAVQAIVSWLTNEPATSQVFYQRGFAKTSDPSKEFSQKTPLDPNFIKRHILVITNFESGAVYQFQVESVDSSGNATRSKTYTILTPRQKESVFQVIMNNMEDTFSWVGQVGI
ncbi:MAG: fibronectin type III domain-containing protein, partial [Patescibacteria group bacterium]